MARDQDPRCTRTSSPAAAALARAQATARRLVSNAATDAAPWAAAAKATTPLPEHGSATWLPGARPVA
jgi:hypothetical protein